MVLRQKQKIYRHYDQVKLINMNILQELSYYKFMFSPLGKAFEKQIKMNEDQGRKQVQDLKAVKVTEHQ